MIQIYKDRKEQEGKKSADAWWQQTLSDMGADHESFDDFSSRLSGNTLNFAKGLTLSFNDDMEGALHGLGVPGARPAEVVRASQEVGAALKPGEAMGAELLGNLATGYGISKLAPAGIFNPAQQAGAGNVTLGQRMIPQAAYGAAEGAVMAGAEDIGSREGSLIERIQQGDLWQSPATGGGLGALIGGLSPVAGNIARQATKAGRVATNQQDPIMADTLFAAMGDTPMRPPNARSIPLEQGGPRLRGVFEEAAMSGSMQDQVEKRLAEQVANIDRQSLVNRDRIWGRWRNTVDASGNTTPNARLPFNRRSELLLHENRDLIANVVKNLPPESAEQIQDMMLDIAGRQAGQTTPVGLPIPNPSLSKETAEMLRTSLAELGQSDSKLAGRAGRLANDMVNKLDGPVRNNWREAIDNTRRVFEDAENRMQSVTFGQEAAEKGGRQAGAEAATQTAGLHDPIYSMTYRSSYLPRTALSALYTSRAPTGNIAASTGDALMDLLTRRKTDLGPTLERGRRRAQRLAGYERAGATAAREAAQDTEPPAPVQNIMDWLSSMGGGGA
jgi:hypothetical protein